MLYLANINKDLFKTKFKDNKIEVKTIFIFCSSLNKE